MQSAVRGSSQHSPAGAKGQLQIILHFLLFRAGEIQQEHPSHQGGHNQAMRARLKYPRQENTHVKVYQQQSSTGCWFVSETISTEGY